MLEEIIRRRAGGRAEKAKHPMPEAKPTHRNDRKTKRVHSKIKNLIFAAVGAALFAMGCLEWLTAEVERKDLKQDTGKIAFAYPDSVLRHSKHGSHWERFITFGLAGAGGYFRIPKNFYDYSRLRDAYDAGESVEVSYLGNGDEKYILPAEIVISDRDSLITLRSFIEGRRGEGRTFMLIGVLIGGIAAASWAISSAAKKKDANRATG